MMGDLQSAREQKDKNKKRLFQVKGRKNIRIAQVGGTSYYEIPC
jgi:hypothetical protein